MKNLLKFGFLLFFLVFGAISCDKEVSDSSSDTIENTLEKAFFEIGYIENANPHVLESLKTRNKKIKPDKLQKIFQKRKQLREEVEAIGYISWENLILFRGDEDDEDAIVLVPILTETSMYCTGFAYIGYLPDDHARYRIVARTEIEIMPFRRETIDNSFYCKEMAISAISACDTELFGNADCELVNIIRNQGEEKATVERADCRVVYDLTEICYCYNNNGYAFNDQWGCDYTDCYFEISSETVCGDSSTGGGTIGGGVSLDTDQDALNVIKDYYNKAKLATIDVEVNIEFIALQAIFYVQNHRKPNLKEKALLYIRAYWNVINNNKHEFLDIAGLLPIIGETADVINGFLYVIEGDPVNAGISFAAVVPFVGWGATAGKYVALAVKTPTGKIVNLSVKKVADGTIEFGGNLRTSLGMLKGDIRHAHHLIPEALYKHPLIQKIGNAATSGANFFHMNHPKNGIPVDAWRNQPNHNTYND